MQPSSSREPARSARPGSTRRPALLSLSALLALCLSGCDPTAPQYRMVYALRHGDSCVLVLQTMSHAEQGARFQLYRSEKGDMADWKAVGADRSGLSYGAVIFKDELLVFHEKSVSAIGLSGDPPPWRSLDAPFEGALECGEELGGDLWVFGKDNAAKRLSAAKYSGGSLAKAEAAGPEIAYESFLLLAFPYQGKIAVAWRGLSEGKSLPDLPVEYCTFDGARFSDVRKIDLPDRGFVTMWSEGETIAGVLQRVGDGYRGRDPMVLFRADAQGGLSKTKIEGSSRDSILFRFLYLSHVEITGKRYVFRTDTQTIEGWRMEGDRFDPIGKLNGIPVYEHEGWIWGLIASMVSLTVLTAAWVWARRRQRKPQEDGSRAMFGTIAQRVAAYLIDLALMWCIGLAAMRMIPSAMRDPEWILPMQVDFSRAWFGVVMAYTTLFEWAAGATPGKWLVGLRLVREDGASANLWQILMRNLIGFYERNPLLAPLCALPVMALSHKVQRVGDILARTVVLTKEGAKIAAATGRMPGMPPPKDEPKDGLGP